MRSGLEALDRLVELLGDDVLRVTDRGNAWPARAQLLVGTASVPVALHVRTIGLSHRKRDDVERRFQNPGSNRPVENHGPERPSVLIGLWEDDELLGTVKPVVAMADPVRRFDHQTRFSIFTKLDMLREARERGWAEDVSTSGEELLAFTPTLLPVAFERQQSAVEVPPARLQDIVESAGLLDDPADTEPRERAVRAGLTLVRDAAFSRKVRLAYGNRCAMCGIGLKLVQGAHIYPVAAPGSSDSPTNGLALCANHHVAFDNHDIAVVPATFEIVKRPAFVAESGSAPAEGLFLGGTARHLSPPLDPSCRPSPEFFRKRYEYFADKDGVSFDWIPKPGEPRSR